MLFRREIAAFLQLTVMPGAVVLGVLRPGFGRVRSMLLIPGLSLPVNYIFAASALAAGVFRPALSAAYTAAVWLAAVWLWRRELVRFLSTPPEIGERAAKTFAELAEWFRRERGERTLLSLALAGSAAGVFFYLLWFGDAADHIFTCWDSALSWNVWAESWARGNFPANVSEYPQLLPMNWALAYQLIGGPVQFVPKFSISLFPLLTVLFFPEYGISRKKIEMVLTVPILSFYFANVDYLSHGGELDLLVAYWSAAVFFTLL